MRMTKGILAAGALALFAGAAQAATVTFDFAAAASSGQQSSINYSAGGIDLVVSSSTYDIGPGNAVTTGALETKVLNKFKGGLSVSHTCKVVGCDDNFRVDGSQFNELLSFSFSKAVTLESIMFNGSKLAADDFFDLIVNGTVALSDLATVGYDVASGFTGSLFGIGASADTSAFRITGLTVSYDDTTPVPLPAGGLLALSGLGALVAARRKARRA